MGYIITPRWKKSRGIIGTLSRRSLREGNKVLRVPIDAQNPLDYEYIQFFSKSQYVFSTNLIYET